MSQKRSRRDISEQMIAWSRQRTQEEGVADVVCGLKGLVRPKFGALL
jgi:hypothetical protein